MSCSHKSLCRRFLKNIKNISGDHARAISGDSGLLVSKPHNRTLLTLLLSACMLLTSGITNASTSPIVTQTNYWNGWVGGGILSSVEEAANLEISQLQSSGSTAYDGCEYVAGTNMNIYCPNYSNGMLFSWPGKFVCKNLAGEDTGTGSAGPEEPHSCFSCPDGYDLNGAEGAKRCDLISIAIASSSCPVVTKGPINTNTGNKYKRETDISPGGIGSPGFSRYYNHQVPVASVRGSELNPNQMGRNWRHEYQRSIVLNPSTGGYPSMVFGHRPEGKVFYFLTSNGVWEPQADIPYALEELMDSGGLRTGWRLTNENGDIESYDSEGKFVSIVKLDGTILNITYIASDLIDQVTSNTGKLLSFSYNSKQQLIGVTDQSSRVWAFSYDGLYNLQFVTNPDDSVKQYHYEDIGHVYALTGITDERGIRYSTYGYDVEGLVSFSTLANDVERIDITYQADGVRTLTSSLGQSSIYSTSLQLGVALVTNITGPGCAACGSGNTSYDYDPANNNLLSKTKDGVTTSYGNYDTKGQYGYKIEAVSTTEQRRTDYTYDARYFNKITSITEPSVFAGSNKITTYAHDAFGNRTSMVVNGFQPDGTSVSRTTTYQYSGPLNQLTQINGPRTDVTDVTTLAYYANDVIEGNNRTRLQSITGPEGIVLRNNLQYSATGKVLSEDRPNGLSITYTYYSGNDRLETLTESAAGSSRTTQWTYLATGEVETIAQADGTALATTTRLVYDDARRLTGLVDHLGNHIDYTLDTEGNRLNEEVFDVNNVLLTSVQQSFDIYNRLDTRTLVDEIIDYNFQPDGTLGSNVNSKNVTTDFQYDALKRLTSVTGDVDGLDANTQNTLTRYTYDVANRLTAVTSPNNSNTTYSYDDLGSLLSENSPDRGLRAYTYDEGGNVQTVTDTRPVTVEYTYDALNRVTSINYPGVDEDVTMSYDSVVGCSNGTGRLCQVIDPSGSTTYSYDGFGNQANQAHTELGFTYQTTYSYDLLNRITQTITPTGRSINTSYDTLGRVININARVNGAAKTIITNVIYRGDGLLTNKDYGNGFTEQRLYDAKGRLTSQTLPVRNAGGQP